MMQQPPAQGTESLKLISDALKSTSGDSKMTSELNHFKIKNLKFHIIHYFIQLFLINS